MKLFKKETTTRFWQDPSGVRQGEVIRRINFEMLKYLPT
jgi:hypothetical protein